MNSFTCSSNIKIIWSELNFPRNLVFTCRPLIKVFMYSYMDSPSNKMYNMLEEQTVQIYEVSTSVLLVV